MSMTTSTAGRIVVCLVLCVAFVGCSSSDVSESSAETSPSVSEPSAETPPSTEPTSALESDRADAIDDLATLASQQASAMEMPTLLLIVNETSDMVLLTSADGQNTATVNPGKSLRLTSKRVCDWLPLTASASDGRVIEEYTQPCDGQTWTITD